MLLRRVSIAVVTAAAMFFALSAPSATAATVLLGSPNPALIVGGTSFNQAVTFSQGALPGAIVTSPVDGLIVRWRFANGEAGKRYSLRVLDPKGGLQFFGAGRTAEVTAAGFGLETFSTVLPIRAGQSIGVDLETNARIAARSANGATSLVFRPTLAEGSVATATVASSQQEIGLQAEVRPAPTITAVVPASGPVRGGNPVVIEGADLQGATSVEFGQAPAASFRVDSEGQIAATAPEAAAPGTVPVSVTTVAGTATSPGGYAYVAEAGNPGEGGGASACVVPKLKGKRLKGAKKVLRAASCRIGAVRKRAGATARRGRVVGQSPRPGRVLDPGSKVNVTLR